MEGMGTGVGGWEGVGELVGGVGRGGGDVWVAVENGRVRLFKNRYYGSEGIGRDINRFTTLNYCPGLKNNLSLFLIKSLTFFCCSGVSRVTHSCCHKASLSRKRTRGRGKQKNWNYLC